MIFDLDGTLVDSTSTIVESFVRAAGDLGFPPPPRDAIAVRIGLPLDQMFRELVTEDPEHRQALFHRYREHFWPLEAEHARVFDGVPELLGELGGHGVTLAVASSKLIAGIERVLGRYGLRDHFAHVLGMDQVARPKPHPDMVEVTLAALGVPREAAVMVGDTEFDLVMARDAGIRAVGVTWGAHDAARLEAFAPVARTVPELRDHLLGADAVLRRG